MARVIDSEVAYRFLSEQLVKETGAFSKGVNKGLNIARSAMRNPDAIPTLTPPNEPLPLEQLREMDVEKVWRGEWVGVPSMGVYDTVCSKCGYCPGIRFWSSDFCPHCGAPMTDQAVDMVMERLEALHSETKTD